jgi:monoamine oxidase
MDYIIVGAGIAGLHCALRISEAFPKAKITIAELYGKEGGRIDTYRNKKFEAQWEAGAGRIHSSHRLTLDYIRKYGLTLYPISEKTQYISDSGNTSKDLWPSISQILYESLSQMNPLLLQTHTLEEILDMTFPSQKHKAALSYFPYCSEMTTLRADLALKSISKELGSNSKFFVVKEGLGAMIAAMKKELVKRKVEFLFHHRLIAVKGDQSELHFVAPDKKNITLTAKHVILTLPSEALKGVQPFPSLPMLKHISMRPLLRTYAIFPTPAWFKDMPRTITDSPLRHIIPINPQKGSIMISYTDGKDTAHWSNILEKNGEMALSASIMKETRDLLKVNIPNPLFFKAHCWKNGCSYWLPGLYSPEEESVKLMRPLPLRFPNVYLCGESYSMHQAWIEGALQHAEDMLKKYLIN